MEPTQPALPSTVLGNIDTILKLEQRAERQIPPASRVAHAVGAFVGSIWFAALQLALMASWIALNSGLWPGAVFDPYPFSMLGTVVSSESVFLTAFVLVKQNRESARASQRSNLDLQVNLLSEKELTTVLQIVQRISDRVGAERLGDPELTELLADTAVAELAQNLEGRADKLAGGEKA